MRAENTVLNNAVLYCRSQYHRHEQYGFERCRRIPENIYLVDITAIITQNTTVQDFSTLCVNLDTEMESYRVSKGVHTF